MTMFDERERAFENLFAHEEEQRFRAIAHRNRLFARWAAEQIGLRGADYHAYVRWFSEQVVEPRCERLLFDRVREDFLAAGVEAPDERIWVGMERAAGEAVRQVRGEPHPSTAADARDGSAASRSALTRTPQ